MLYLGALLARGVSFAVILVLFVWLFDVLVSLRIDRQAAPAGPFGDLSDLSYAWNSICIHMGFSVDQHSMSI